jgi:putative hydrolase of the HAD superfamily
MIRAISFDFWDTLVVDDSDEPSRVVKGLPPKSVARRRLFVDSVLRSSPALRVEAVEGAYAYAQSRFRHHWKVEHRTPSVADRLALGLEQLSIDAPADFDAVVHGFETMEVTTPPQLVPNIGEALQALSERYILGIISDAIVTPGRGLREILGSYGLLDYFKAPVFSDEVGAAKPSPVVFQAACEGLGVAPFELVHVGDREANDIAGPQAFGAKAVLYTGAIDRGSATSKADIVCDDVATLMGQLGRWS